MKDNFFEKVYYWFKYDFRYLPHNIKYGIVNLFKWLPTIWYDRDYDYNYIYEVLKFKLKKQADYLAKKNRFESTSRQVEIINLVVKLIEREQDDFYGIEHFDYHNSDFRFELIPSDSEVYENTNSEELYEMVVDEISENYDDYFAKYPRQYKKAINGELNKFTRRDNHQDNKHIYAMEIGEENQKRNKELLFKILNKNINRWWD